MKTNLSIVILLMGLISCNNNQKRNDYSKSNDATVEKSAQNADFSAKGYELMTQKCYLCHFEKPDPSKKDYMIAPPMLRVQEHYKPAYPNKTE